MSEGLTERLRAIRWPVTGLVVSSLLSLAASTIWERHAYTETWTAWTGALLLVTTIVATIPVIILFVGQRTGSERLPLLIPESLALLVASVAVTGSAFDGTTRQPWVTTSILLVGLLAVCASLLPLLAAREE